LRCTCGEQRLVALWVGQRRLDVGRQRHGAEAFDGLVDVAAVVVLEADDARTRVPCRVALDGGTEPVTERDASTLAEAASRPDQARVAAITQVVQDQQLDGPTMLAAGAQACGANPGVVDDEQIAGAEQVGQLGEGTVLRGAVPRQVQQPRGVALGERRLGDALLGERILEERGVLPDDGGPRGQKSEACAWSAPGTWAGTGRPSTR
jgi:hypothetical protein